MQTRWMNRRNKATGVDERFYPVTHKDAIVDLNSAGEDLGLVKSGGDATIIDGVITVNDDSHNHVISNIDGLQSILDDKLNVTDTAVSALTLKGLTATINELNILDGVTATATELNYMDGVTSNVQTQLDELDSNLLLTELASEVVGESPDIDPAITNLVNSLTAEDVGARPDTWMPTASDVGAVEQPIDGLTTPILEIALTGTKSVRHFPLAGDGYTGNDLPHKNYSYGMATVFRRSSGSITVMLWGLGATVPIMCNYYNGSTWSGWSTAFLPLTGGTLSGALKIGNSLEIVGTDTVLQMTLNKAYGNNVYTYLSMSNAEALDSMLQVCRNVSGTRTNYKLFGQHNKPSGSYTGNGSATERTINVGGLGAILFIQGANYNSLVTYYGAICWSPQSGTVQAVSDGSIYFRNGVLTIKSSSSIFNANGSSYNYGAL